MGFRLVRGRRSNYEARRVRVVSVAKGDGWTRFEQESSDWEKSLEVVNAIVVHIAMMMRIIGDSEKSEERNRVLSSADHTLLR
jgi:hypothetical protein